jgi:hypothetical protein
MLHEPAPETAFSAPQTIDGQPQVTSSPPPGLRWRDEKGKEMSQSASVWQAYLQEAMRYDIAERDRWSQSMDSLFIFVRIFYIAKPSVVLITRLQ